MPANRSFAASGEGSSFFRFSIAFRAMPSGAPSFAARSKSSVGTPALARWAAICAPMTPAPRMAALRTRKRDCAMSGRERWRFPENAAPQDLRRGRRAEISGKRSLERIGGLQADDVAVVMVGASDQAVGIGAAFVLIDAGVTHKYVRITEVQGKLGRGAIL